MKHFGNYDPHAAPDHSAVNAQNPLTRRIGGDIVWASSWLSAVTSIARDMDAMLFISLLLWSARAEVAEVVDLQNLALRPFGPGRKKHSVGGPIDES